MDQLILLNKINQNMHLLENEGIRSCKVYISSENSKVKVNLFCDRNNVELSKFARLEETLRKAVGYRLIELIDESVIPVRLMNLVNNDMIALSY